MTRTLGLAVAAAMICLAPAALDAQSTLDTDPGSSVRSRQELEELLASYEQALLSPAYSAAVKDVIRTRAGRVRTRLTEGDFKLGDRVVLFVQGEPTLPDTIPVQAGPRITLPLFGDISLAGTLRSEVSGRITEALRAFIRDPVVRAEGLMRVSVQGAVGQPGFYVVPADMLLSETLMMAGGPAPNSNIGSLRVERAGEVLLTGVDAQEALRLGYTLDQLNLQAGDQVMVPVQTTSGGFWARAGIVLGTLTSISILVFQLVN